MTFPVAFTPKPLATRAVTRLQLFLACAAFFRGL
jgi:hypothetical protein